jgi:hypothetical protein
LFALSIGLVFMAALGVTIACIAFHISPWIWAIPLFAAFIFGMIFVVRHGDRVVAATSSTKDASDALPNDA